MARPRGQGEKTKELIAEKAKVVFQQKGYAGASMEEIRSFSRVSKGSIYYHFKSKEELFLYAVEKTAKIWREKWEDNASKVETASEKLYLLAKYYASDMQNPLSQIVPEYMATENKEKIFEDKIVQLIEPEYEVFYQIIEEGIVHKEFKSEQSIEDLAYILYGMLTGLSITQFLNYDEEQFVLIYKQAIDVFLAGISGTPF